MSREILLFILPSLIILTIFVIYPVAATLLLSLNIDIIPVYQLDEEPGIQNFIEAFTNVDVFNPDGLSTLSFPMGALIHNFIWVLIHLPLTTFLGFILAILLYNLRSGWIIRSIIFLGMVVPMVVGGLLIMFSFDRDIGVVNLAFKLFGLDALSRSWTIYPDTALIALILGSIWLWTGFSLIAYTAGLASIPKEIIEAAKVDGASMFTITFKIILPMLKPVTLTVVAMTILWDLKIFDIVYVATGGGPGGASMVLSILMWEYFVRLIDYPMSATIAAILTLIILPPAAIWVRQSLRGVR